MMTCHERPGSCGRGVLQRVEKLSWRLEINQINYKRLSQRQIIGGPKTRALQHHKPVETFHFQSETKLRSVRTLMWLVAFDPHQLRWREHDRPDIVGTVKQDYFYTAAVYPFKELNNEKWQTFGKSVDVSHLKGKRSADFWSDFLSVCQS